jgi:hypothetical protein
MLAPEKSRRIHVHIFYRTSTLRLFRPTTLTFGEDRTHPESSKTLTAITRAACATPLRSPLQSRVFVVIRTDAHNLLEAIIPAQWVPCLRTRN